MKVMGERKKGIEYLYIFSELLGAFILVMAILSEEPILMVMGVLVIIVSFVVLFGILSTPKNVIVLDEVENKLYLPKNQTVYLKDISFVAYKKAKAKHHEYKWGEVHIQVNGNLIRCKYVRDCEMVARELFTLVEKTKEQEIIDNFGE